MVSSVSRVVDKGPDASAREQVLVAPTSCVYDGVSTELTGTVWYTSLTEWAKHLLFYMISDYIHESEPGRAGF